MGSAEENRQWVRDRVERLGLTEEIAMLAHIRYLALYANQKTIDDMFQEIAEAQ